MAPKKSLFKCRNFKTNNFFIIFVIISSLFFTTSSTTQSPDRHIYPVPYGVTASTDLSMKIHIEWYVQCGDAYSDHFNIYAKAEGDYYTLKVGQVSYYSCTSGVPFEYDFYMDGISDFPYEDYTITIETSRVDGIGGSSDPSTPVIGSAIIDPPHISATDGTFDDRIEVSFYEFTFNSLIYRVYRSSTINGTYDYVGYTYGDNEPDLNGTYVDDDVSAGTGYYYKGRICTTDNDCSELSASPAFGFASATGPSGISATDGTEDQYIDITWTSTGATSYRLYRSETDSAPAENLYYAEVYSNHYQDYGADPYTTYYYWVRSYDAGTSGWSSPSGPDTGWRPYEPARNVVASKGTSSTSIDVTWGHDDEEVTLYLISRSETSDGTKTTVGSSSTESFSDTMALAGKTYYYFIQSCDDQNRCSAVVGGIQNDGYRTMTDTTNIAATDGTSTAEVTVTWDPVFGATSYEIYRRTDTNALLATKIGTVTSESFSDTSATPGTTYNYWVKGCSDEMCNSLSTWNSGWRAMPVPGNVQASDGAFTDRVAVSWDSVSDAEYYEVFRANSPTDPPVQWSGSVTGTTYNDPVATTGVTYYYGVRACNYNACGEISALDSGWQNIGIPTNVQASDGTVYPYIEITWAGVAHATYYQLYYGVSELDTPILLSGNAGIPYQDSDAEPGENRGYWVRACNEYICGDLSGFETGSRGIYDVTGISATDGDYDMVTISWTNISDSVTYDVYRSDTETGTKTKLDSVTGMTYFEDTSATPGTTYHYWVNQCGPDVCSNFTENDTGWRRGGDLPVVTSVDLLDASPTNAASVDFIVSFSKDVTGVDVTDFSLTASVTNPSITGVTGTGSTRTVSVNTGSGSGTLRLDVVDDNSIVDDITNELGGPTAGDGDFSDGEVYTIDRNDPVITSFLRHIPTSMYTSADYLSFRVEFSEDVVNVSSDDFEIASTSTTSIDHIDPISNQVYDIYISGGDLADYNGTVGLDLSTSQDIEDQSGNSLVQSEPATDQTYELDNTLPNLSIERFTPAEEFVSVDQVTFLISFTKEVSNVDETDFVVSGGTTATISAFGAYQQSATEFLVTVSGGDLDTFNGILGLDLNPSQNIVDNLGNALPQEEPAVDETYTFDHVFPEVSLAGDALPGVTLTFITGPTEITIEFSEEVLADGSENAANNTENYLLFSSGANGVYDTLSCAQEELGNTGDDTFLPVGPAVYDDNDGNGPFNVTLTLNDGTPLPLGEYKLFVCGTTSITDPSGNELNDGESDAFVILEVIEPEKLPETGFTPSINTILPSQPIGKSYDISYGLWLNITKIDTLAPIVGVPAVNNEWDLTWLGSDIGYLQGTAFPTWSGNTALTGHVYTSNGSPGPFANLSRLSWGDKIRIYTAGLEYVYEVRTVNLYVDPSDLSVVADHDAYDWLTLITCNGYDAETDEFLWRTVVRAVLVEINHAD